ncbi:MAG: HAD family hydrolase [Lentisphaerae bacterium]|nr:HAD family hydrolase [Lentisphaerota bacterium]
MDLRRTTAADLIALRPAHDAFVGVDSDGCVFDTMDVKQKNHFHPLICSFWGLERIEAQVRAAAEFVNIGSKTRGQNRFTNLLLTFELLETWDVVRASGVPLPRTGALRAYCQSGLPLGNPSLHAEVARSGDPDLTRVLEWSLAVNADIDTRMAPTPPFPWALKSLDRIARACDAIVVSQTPEEALLKEWHHHGIADRVAAITGQEVGSKARQIRLATDGRYQPGRVLLIGDAPGDLAAATEASVLFYPILPGREDASWCRFHDESFDRFLAGTYAGAYAGDLTRAFLDALPDTPPWQSPASRC